VKKQIEKAIKAYDKIAEIYSKYTYNQIQQYQLTKFISLLKGKKILDVGCGCGRDVEYFLQEGYNAIGVDLSEKMLKQANKIVPKIKLKKQDFTDLQFKKESFHGIWSMVSLVNIPRKKIIKVLKGFNDILTKKGILYLTVEEGEGEKNIKKPKYNNELIRYVYFTEEEMQDYLKKAGFKILESEIIKLEDCTLLEIFAEKE
jgi:ubiquinone/menaquinone biosynthesis C-methylase UbiE